MCAEARAYRSLLYLCHKELKDTTNMKKTRLCAAALALAATPALAQVTQPGQMEKLDRGVVAVKNGANLFVSWRFLGTDSEDATTFDVLKNGETAKKNLYATNTSLAGNASDRIQVVTKRDGVATDTTEAVTPWADLYKTVKLDRPAAGTNIKGYEYTYSPNDCSAGDVDGDGQYELVVKWDPSNSQDNGHADTGTDEWTGNVILDCYRLDGTRLWRIDLGRNIRAGAHYTQFLVYDFDGDGRAEVVCKTAPGSTDGKGNYVNQAATDATIKGHDNTKTYYNKTGQVLSGPEYLTVFSGLTGEAIHTVWYNPNRAGTLNKEGAHPSDKDFWGDNYGNRAERYLACVAYLDGAGKNPSAVMCRGYYTRAYLWAVNFDGKELSTKWIHQSTSKSNYSVVGTDFKSKAYAGKAPTGRKTGSKTAYSNGNHNLSVADVDGDGCDEIVYGACAIDNDGKLLYSTGYGHGDAIHVGKFVPGRDGLQVFSVHEDKPYGWDLHDAATGEVLHSATGSADNGRGLCADIDAENPGGEFMSSNDRSPRSCATGNAISEKSTSLNFRTYWDGDLQEELFDGGKIDKWNGNGTTRLYIGGKNLYDYGSSSTCNSTKQTPCLQADLFGDWREEIVLFNKQDCATLNVFTTLTPTAYRVPTLMHDHVYRMGVAWQNAGYNQPPHLGYCLADSLAPRRMNPATVVTANLGDSVTYSTRLRYVKQAMLTASFAPDGTKKSYGMVDGFEKTVTTNREVAFKGKASQPGDYRFAFRYTGLDGEQVHDTITVRVAGETAIGSVTAQGGKSLAQLAGSTLLLARGNGSAVSVTVYDTAGRTLFSRTVNPGRQPSVQLPVRAAGTYIIKVDNGRDCEVIKTRE